MYGFVDEVGVGGLYCTIAGSVGLAVLAMVTDSILLTAVAAVVRVWTTRSPALPAQWLLAKAASSYAAVVFSCTE